jgi:hypothetical protein
MTKIFTFLVGQSCGSSLYSWAAQQRRPAEDVEILVMRPFPPCRPPVSTPIIPSNSPHAHR